MRALLVSLWMMAAWSAGGMAAASPAAPKNGAEYTTLPVAQETAPGPRVEVTEFFAYYCPHCHAFEPVLAAWVKKQGDNIVFKRVHVQHNPAVVPQQRLFYTLEAMGLVPQYHDKVFHAMHVERKRLSSDEQVLDWVKQSGIDLKKFTDTYRSFGMPASLRRADGMMASYNITSWPTIAIGGRYLTSPWQASLEGAGGVNEAQQQQMALQVMDYLVAKAKAEKK